MKQQFLTAALLVLTLAACARKNTTSIGNAPSTQGPTNTSMPTTPPGQAPAYPGQAPANYPATAPTSAPTGSGVINNGSQRPTGSMNNGTSGSTGSMNSGSGQGSSMSNPQGQTQNGAAGTMNSGGNGSGMINSGSQRTDSMTPAAGQQATSGSSMNGGQQQAVASPAATATQQVNGKTITINYAQPAVKGRKVWDANGELAPYGKVWRTGANKATTFETSRDLMVEGKKLPAGKYSLFTIPGEKEWTIIFNKVADQWGAYKYNEAEDMLRVKVPAHQMADNTERLTMNIEPAGKVNLMWEHAHVAFNVK